MAIGYSTDSPPSMAALLGGIVNDAQNLIRQEVQLARTEVRQEWDKTKAAAQTFTAGMILLVFGAIFLGLAIGFVLHEVVGLPLWASFLILGGPLSLVGAGLLYSARNQAGQIQVIPPQTVATLRENVQWIQHPT